MAIDPSKLLQMLLQGGGGGTEISPISGLQEPSLSGLILGPQGMGFGGGESLMGGGPTGFGGGVSGGLGGLDISQLLAQLQGAPGVTGAGLTAPIGAGSFGAGGGMGEGLGGSPQPTPSQQGQAGLGAANTTTQLLGILKEGTGLVKALTQLFPKGPTPTDLQGLNLPELTAFSPALGTNLSSLEQLSAANPGLFSLTGNVSATPAIDPSKFAGAFGGLAPFNLEGIEALGPGGAPALAGELGPAGTVVSGGGNLIDSLGGLSGVLGGAGVLSNLGFGALNLAQGNLGPGIGGLAGTGLGLGLGAALAPETAGLSLLLGGIGGGGGGLLGGLFGGGGPSEAWRSFGPRLAATLGGERTAAADFVQTILNARTPQDLERARQTFLGSVEASGVGGFATRPAPSGWVVPELPGATGTSHEGGALWNPNAFNTYLNLLYMDTLFALQNPGQFDLGTFQQGFLPLLQQSIQSPGGNTFGKVPPLGSLASRPSSLQATAPTPAPPTSPMQNMTIKGPADSLGGLNLPGSPDTDLLTLLRRMGLS